MEKIYSAYNLPSNKNIMDGVKDKYLIAFSDDKKMMKNYVDTRYGGSKNIILIKEEMKDDEYKKFIKNNREYRLCAMEYKFKDKDDLSLNETTIISNSNEYEWVQMEFQRRLDNFIDLFDDFKSFVFKKKYRDALKKLNFSLLEVYWNNSYNRYFMDKLLDADEYNDAMEGPDNYEIDELQLLIELFLDYGEDK